MKRLISLILAVLMLFALSAAAQAKTVVTYGDWVIEKINGDTRLSLDQYIGEAQVIYVPRLIEDIMVTNIADYCFAGNDVITAVYTSSPMIRIGNYAFIGCDALKSFECNYAMSAIGEGAFSGCTSLNSINLEESSITTVRKHTFTDTALTAVALPGTCTTVEEYAFLQCRELERILIPDSVTTIAETAFNGCENLVIYCNADSYAHTYAAAQGIEYVLLDEPAEISFVLGDADGDGKITILDATKIQRVLAALIADADGMIALRGDSDDDGLNILDATRVQRYLASLNVTAAIGETVTREVSVSW